MIIKGILESYVKSKAMEKTFLVDRERTVGASEIGQCSRQMGWLKNDKLRNRVQRDTDHVDNWGARVRGTVMEEKFWLPALRRRFRSKLLIAGTKQQSVHDRYLSATLDGLLIGMHREFLAPLGVPDIGPSGCVTVECKTIDPRVNLTQAKAEHRLQVQAGLGLIRALTRYKPEYALVSYIDASFWSDVDEFAIAFDERVYETLHARAVKIKTADRPDELQPEGWIAGGNECEYCPFTRACGVVRRSVPEREAMADPQFVAEITDMCREHERLNSDAKDLESRKKELQDQIKTRLREKSVRKLPGIVTWSSVKGRTSTKTEGLKAAAVAAGVDVSQFETTGDPTDQLRVLVGGTPEA